MGWWSRRSRRGTSGTPPVLATLTSHPQEVALGVHACTHEVESQGRSRPCWSFFTRGLLHYGQAELVLAYVPSGSERLEDVSPHILRFLEIMRELASKGQTVGIGASTSFRSPTAVLGATGVLYLPLPPEGPAELPDPYLCAVPLFGPEADAVVRLGHPRIAGRIGLHFRTFPCAWWWPAGRGVVAAFPGDEASILWQTPHGSLRGLYARVDGGPRHEDRRRLLLRVDRPGRETLRTVLARATDRVVGFLVPGLDPDADSLMVWIPGDPVPTAIARGAFPGLRTGLCFVGLGFPADRDEWAQIEDGAVALLTAPSWSRLRHAVEQGEPTELPMSDGRTLAFECIPEP
jgi:hypothetical protein